MQLLAKLESRMALVNYMSIVASADGTIMSRGNLGLDVAPEKMALIQKGIISSCNLLGKPVLITRVVDTMVNVPRPTRCCAAPPLPTHSHPFALASRASHLRARAHTHTRKRTRPHSLTRAHTYSPARSCIKRQSAARCSPSPGRIASAGGAPPPRA